MDTLDGVIQSIADARTRKANGAYQSENDYQKLLVTRKVLHFIDVYGLMGIVGTTRYHRIIERTIHGAEQLGLSSDAVIFSAFRDVYAQGSEAFVPAKQLPTRLDGDQEAQARDLKSDPFARMWDPHAITRDLDRVVLLMSGSPTMEAVYKVQAITLAIRGMVAIQAGRKATLEERQQATTAAVVYATGVNLDLPTVQKRGLQSLLHSAAATDTFYKLTGTKAPPSGGPLLMMPKATTVPAVRKRPRKKAPSMIPTGHSRLVTLD